MPALRRLGDRVGIVVPADDIGAAGHERAGAGQPGAAEPEHRDLFSGESR